MRILSIEEIPTGFDEVMSAQISERRQVLGVSLADAAEATGAEFRELALIENGNLAAFSDPERLRLVVLAYCDYLGLEPGPVLARLEVYTDWELLNPPNLFALRGPEEPFDRPRPSLSFLAFAMGMVFLAGLLVLHLVGR